LAQPLTKYRSEDITELNGKTAELKEKHDELKGKTISVWSSRDNLTPPAT